MVLGIVGFRGFSSRVKCYVRGFRLMMFILYIRSLTIGASEKWTLIFGKPHLGSLLRWLSEMRLGYGKPKLRPPNLRSPSRNPKP